MIKYLVSKKFKTVFNFILGSKISHKRIIETGRKFHFFPILAVFNEIKIQKKIANFLFVNQMTWNLAQKSVITPYRSSLNMRMIGWKKMNLWWLKQEIPFLQKSHFFRYLCYIFLFFQILLVLMTSNQFYSLIMIKLEDFKDFKNVFTFFIGPYMCHRRPFENVHKYQFFLISYFFSFRTF